MKKPDLLRRAALYGALSTNLWMARECLDMLAEDREELGLYEEDWNFLYERSVDIAHLIEDTAVLIKETYDVNKAGKLGATPKRRRRGTGRARPAR